MNRYSYNNGYKHKPFERDVICPDCGWLHSDALKKCPKPTQASLDLRYGNRVDLPVIPATRRGLLQQIKNDLELVPYASKNMLGRIMFVIIFVVFDAAIWVWNLIVPKRYQRNYV